MIFKGKIGVWFWLLLIGGNIALICGGIYEKLNDGEMLDLFFVFFLINIICVPMVIRNYVQIDGEKLIFVLGFCKDYMKIERELCEKNHIEVISIQELVYKTLNHTEKR